MNYQFDKINKSILADDLNHNFYEIIRTLSKYDFLNPDSSSIKKYDGNTYYYHDDEKLPVTINDTSVVIGQSLEYGNNIEIAGNASIITDPVKTAAGFTNATHTALYLIEIPQIGYENIKINGGPVNVLDLYGDGGHLFYAFLQGLYIDNSEVKSENPLIEIEWENYKRTYNTDVTGMILT